MGQSVALSTAICHGDSGAKCIGATFDARNLRNFVFDFASVTRRALIVLYMNEVSRSYVLVFFVIHRMAPVRQRAAPGVAS